MRELLKKEIKQVFFSTLNLVLLFVFLVIYFSLFYVNVISTNILDLGYLFSSLATLVVVLTPFFCFRLLAWENANKTLVTLMLSPQRKINFVLAKYLSVGVLFLVLNVFIMLPFFFVNVIRPIYFPLVLLGLLKINLLFFFILAVASFLSIWTSSPFLNSLITLFSCFFFYFLNQSDFLLQRYPFLAELLAQINPFFHLETFNQGIFSSADVIYFLLAIFYLLLSAGILLEKKQLRQ